MSIENLTRVSVFLLYLAMAVFAYRFLAPRLLPMARWLATIFLAAQIAVIVMSQVTLGDSGVMGWLWNLEQEWNIPTGLASIQWALVGAAALQMAWSLARRPAWRRIYYLALASVILFVAADEFFMFHDPYPNSQLAYAIVGLGICLATAALAWRSPRTDRLWHVSLLAGLAISALGGVLLDSVYAKVCGWGEFFYRCVYLLRWLEEYLEMLGGWLALLAMLGCLSALSRKPRSAFLWAFLAAWFALLVTGDAIPPIVEQKQALSAGLDFASGAHLHAYRVQHFDPEISVDVWLSPGATDLDDFGYSVTLIDQGDLTVLAAVDARARNWIDVSMAPGYQPVYAQRLQLDIPPNAPANRAFWIALTRWRDTGGHFPRDEALSGDLPRLSEAQVILDEFVLPSPRPRPSATALASFDNGFALESLDMPKCAPAGGTLELTFAWRSDAKGQDDHSQFLHLGRENAGEWLVYDQRPLGPRLPTRLWYDGLADRETWKLDLPADMAPGRYAAFTGLYRLSDKERVIARDVAGSPFLDSRVPLGSLLVARAANFCD